MNTRTVIISENGNNHTLKMSIADTLTCANNPHTSKVRVNGQEIAKRNWKRSISAKKNQTATITIVGE